MKRGLGWYPPSNHGPLSLGLPAVRRRVIESKRGWMRWLRRRRERSTRDLFPSETSISVFAEAAA
jgi:hypothetical protein